MKTNDFPAQVNNKGVIDTMKKYGQISAALLLITLSLLFGLTGCGRDSGKAEIETVRGVWKSNDGYSLTLTENTLSLADNNGNNCLPYDCLNYVWTKDKLFVDIEGRQYGVFDVYLKEDTMALTYDTAAMGISDSDVTTINLTRVGK